ncbi:MAG: ATP-binding protein [Deltaproteobacteria bacterium]|nr:MAG: ATP-binding protein [Deltaproteobacteria bacterium]
MALTALSAWAFDRRRAGCRIRPHRSIQTPYTWRTGLLSALATNPPWSDEVNAKRQFHPLCVVSGSRRVEGLHSGVIEVLNITAPAAVKAVGDAVSEIDRNADEHSDSKTPTSFAAGWFHNQRRVSFGVADTGVGILRRLRGKGVADLDDDDKSAIEKALQPHVTGAGRRGVSHAPNNHGIGLHTTRLYARDSGGEMVILSQRGCFVERHPYPARFEDLETTWKGTLVGVTIKPDQVGAFAVSNAGVGVRAGADPAWRETPPEGALVLKPPVDGCRFAADKDWYRRHRPEVLAAIEAGRPVHIAFRKAIYSTQSALHALLAEPVRIHGPRALELLSYSEAGQPLKAALALVVNYALADHYTDPHADEPH